MRNVVNIVNETEMCKNTKDRWDNDSECALYKKKMYL